MASIQEQIIANLEAATGSTGGWNELWCEFLIDAGYSGTLNEMMIQYFIASGYSGTLSEMFSQWIDDGHTLSSWTLAVHDAFEGTQGSTINGRTPDTVNNGSVWFVPNTNINVGDHPARGSKVAYATAQVQFCYINGDISSDGDMIVESECNFAASNYGHAVYARYSDASNFIYAGVSQANNTGCNLYLHKKVANVDTELDKLVIGSAFPADDYLLISLKCDGDSLVATLTHGVDTWSVSATESDLNTNKRAGLYFGDTNQYHDDFKVYVKNN